MAAAAALRRRCLHWHTFSDVLRYFPNAFLTHDCSLCSLTGLQDIVGRTGACALP